MQVRRPASNRPCLGYVIPRYDARSAAHFAHIPRLLEQLARYVDLEVAVWDCRDVPSFTGVRAVHVLRSKGKLARWLELRQLVSRRARHGVRRWFVRGSWLLASAVECSAGETIYWNCGKTFPPVNWQETLNDTISRWVLRRAEVVATAPGLEDTYQQEYGLRPERIVLLDNDIDPERFSVADEPAKAVTRQRLGVPDGRRMLLYVHGLSYKRGAHMLLPLLEGCAAAGQPVTLVAAGPAGDQSEALQAFAASHPEQLILTGEVPNDDLAPLYAAADIFVHPSRGEGFPRVVLEAMAAGTALVSTIVGMVSSILPPATHDLTLVEVDDVEAFNAKVVHLLKNESARAGLVAKLLERVPYYHTEAVARRYADTLFPGSLQNPPVSRPRLLVFGKLELADPFANDQLNHATYDTLLAYCDRIDVVGVSPSAAGHEEHLGNLHVYGAPKLSGIAGHRAFLKYAKQVIEKVEPPTVCWASDALDGGLAALWAARTFDVPLALHVQGSYYALNPVRWSWPQRVVQATLCTFMARRAAVVRTVAKRFIPALLAHGVPPGRLVALPSRTDMSLFEPARYTAERAALRAAWGWSDQVVAVFVGSLNKTKGLDMLLDAFAAAVVDAPELRLALVGGGGELEPLQAQAARLGISELVRFVGSVQHAAVPPHLAAADMFVLSSRDEAMPRCVIEASAMMLPVLATDVGDVREIVRDGETGVLAEISAASLEAGLRQLSALGGEGRAAMGRRGRAHVMAHFELHTAIDEIARRLLFPTPPRALPPSG